MISDTLFEAIKEIEDYQRNWPESYDDYAEDIGIVKKIMSALKERLDTPPGEYPLDIADTLTPQDKHRWRVTCEANIARWTKRLRLLEPVSTEELLEKLEDAIERQKAMLEEWSKAKEKGMKELNSPMYYKNTEGDLLVVTHRLSDQEFFAHDEQGDWRVVLRDDLDGFEPLVFEDTKLDFE